MRAGMLSWQQGLSGGFCCAHALGTWQCCAVLSAQQLIFAAVSSGVICPGLQDKLCVWCANCWVERQSGVSMQYTGLAAVGDLQHMGRALF